VTSRDNFLATAIDVGAVLGFACPLCYYEKILKIEIDDAIDAFGQQMTAVGLR